MTDPHYDKEGVTVHHGDCLDVLRELPDASVDAVVTDPPYGLGFMGKAWDAEFINSTIEKRRQYGGDPSLKAGPNGGYRSAAAEAGRYDLSLTGNRGFGAWCEVWATECLRVLKPGGHLLAFGGTRTWHRLACAIEDAGFEVRDSIAWMYGSGFPKSLDVSKAIDRAAGAEREIVGPRRDADGRTRATEAHAEWNAGTPFRASLLANNIDTAPATDDARTWQGWGTALKPAHEPIVVARKPLSGTVAQTVLTHGTGALNIDAARIAHTTVNGGNLAENPHLRKSARRGTNTDPSSYGLEGGEWQSAPAGRWPANVVLDEGQAAALDTMSGENGPKPTRTGRKGGSNPNPMDWETKHDEQTGTWPGDNGGGASRFFYTAKADAAERVRLEGVAHPTVKPLALMRWLVRLVTPPGGVVLEPFAGSGTTVEACILEGFHCVAIEREPDYLPLILQRIHRRRDPVQAVRATGDDGGLFDLLDDEEAS